MYNIMEQITQLQRLLKNLFRPEHILGRAFIGCLIGAYQQMKYSGTALSDCRVYDIVEAGPNHRFMVSNGVITKNCLGISYGMKAKNLAIKLTNDTGIVHDEEMAQKMIDLFEGLFHVYAEARNNGIVETYDAQRYLKLSDGWTMFGDNPNNLSISNFPTQGHGSVILRKFVGALQDKGLTVIRTLHDAGYVKIKWGEWDKLDTFWETMGQAFYDSYEGHPLQEYARIRLDGEVWGRDISQTKDDAVVWHPKIIEDTGEDVGHYVLTTPKGVEFSAQEIYIDGRAIDDYNRFSDYFKTTLEDRIGGL